MSDSKYNAALYMPIYIVRLLLTALHANVVALKTSNISSVAVHCMLTVEEMENYSTNQLLYRIEDSTLQENKKSLYMEVQQFLISFGRFNQRK